MEYLIPRSVKLPSLKGQWREPAWRRVPAVTLRHFLKQSSTHHPLVKVKLIYTPQSLGVFFKVQDRYVRCIRTKFQSYVCNDSCVEFFVQPKPGRGYLNFEINGGGTMLLYYIEDPQRQKNGFRKFTKVPWKVARHVKIFHSLPPVVDPEIRKPVEWNLEYQIPFSLFATYVGSLGELRGQCWRGNLYKCANKTSHPHWASWAPLGAELDFHLPEYFGSFQFQ